MRLTLSYAAGNDDSLVATLDQFVGLCPGCTADIIMALLDMLVFALNQGGTDWQPVVAGRLCDVLDSMTVAR